MSRWTASAKWAAGPALDGQRDMPLELRLSEGFEGLASMELLQDKCEFLEKALADCGICARYRPGYIFDGDAASRQ